MDQSLASAHHAGMTPEERKLRAQIAANARWSRPFAREDQGEAIRAAIDRRLQVQVDPTGTLPAAEVEALVRSAKKERSARLNFAKAQKRRRRGTP